MESNLFASREVRDVREVFLGRLHSQSKRIFAGPAFFAAKRRLAEGGEKLKSRIEQRKEDFLVVVYSRSCRMEW